MEKIYDPSVLQSTFVQTVADNTASAYVVRVGTDEYVSIDSTDNSEVISIGNTGVNPDTNFLGTGTTTFNTDISVSGTSIFRSSTTRDISYHTRWEQRLDFYSGDGSFLTLNSGTDAEAADPAQDTTQMGGVWQLVTGDVDGTFASDGSQLVWTTDAPVQLDATGGVTVVEARVRINSAITNVSVFFGLTDNTALEEPFSNSADTITSNATDGAGFLYDTDATTDQWWGVAVDSDTDDTGNAALGIAPTADTWQILRMELSSDGATVTFFIDGTQYLQLTGAAGCGPDVVLYPTITACSTTTTSKTVETDWIVIEGVR